MKKILPVLLSTALLLALISSSAFSVFAETTSGTCGENLTWSYSDGVLTISGTGNMKNYTLSYSSHTTPWAPLAIKKVVIENGVTSIGKNAFRYIDTIESVEIPSTVTSIGGFAFHSCNHLTSVEFPDALTTIGEYAFYGCDNLSDVSFGDAVETIGQYAFCICDSLTNIKIPKSVKYIGYAAFFGCGNLSNVYCEAESQPEGWNPMWYRACYPTIHWGCTEEKMAINELNNAIATAKELNEYDYTPEQWAAIQAAIEAAKNFDTNGKTAEEIESATRILNAKISGKGVVIGDVNMNGEIDARDYVLLKRAYFGTYSLTCDLEVADINGSGGLDARDYVLLKRAYFGTYKLQ